MFACHGDCDPTVGIVGLREPDDLDAVLVCRRHLPDLRRLRPYEAARLARYLHVAFAQRPKPVNDPSTFAQSDGECTRLVVTAHVSDTA
jgi:hypothetical protein